MAVRLTVVISQTNEGLRKQQTLEANLIAQLIGRPGIDVSLIGPLAQVEQSATDRLVLEGISGDFVIVTWQSPDQAMEQLAALQIGGRRAAHRADPHTGADSGRRIYCFDCNRFATADELAESLGELLNERRVVTVALASPASISPSASRPQPGELPRVESKSSGSLPHPQPNTQPKEARTSQPNGDAARPPTSPTDDERERAANARLDALVDDLNMLDL